MENKIAIVIPYFGKFPKWMSLFVESCKKNPFIDFIMYSDCDFQYDCPNILYHRTTFAALCNRVSKALKIDFRPQSAYKLCGLKPFYGYIFREDLVGYNFWGFCDIDLVLGDLRTFFSLERLNKYDILSTQGDRIAGPLCIVRNNERFVRLPFQIKGWKEKLQSRQMIPLDEKYFSDVVAPELKLLRGINSYLLRRLLPLKMAKVVNDLLSWPVLTLTALLRKQYYKEMNATPEIGVHGMKYIYQDGKVRSLYESNELPYLHFLFFKKNRYRDTHLWNEETPLDTTALRFELSVRIDETGIHNEHS